MNGPAPRSTLFPYTTLFRSLDVRATVCLVDPADFGKPTMRTNPVFVDQVQMADVVVMNKLDTASPELVSEFQAWTKDRKSTRLNSSHTVISYAVFCLKKKT